MYDFIRAPACDTGLSALSFAALRKRMPRPSLAQRLTGNLFLPATLTSPPIRYIWATR
jgi:hypothetical protein